MAPVLGVHLACEKVLGVLKVVGVQSVRLAEQPRETDLGLARVWALRAYARAGAHRFLRNLAYARE